MRRAAAAAALALLAPAAGCGGGASPPRARRPAMRVVTLRSPALAGAERYAAWLPPGYARSRRRYPVVYLLHGLPAGPGAFRDGRGARLAAIAAARGSPVLVVAPQGARRGDADPEWHDWGRGRDWEMAVARDVVRDVDRRFRTIADRRARALIGFSAGGYGAMLIGLRHPETFTVIESWSGYFHPTNPRGDAPLDLGDPRADARADGHRFVACIGRLAAADRPRLLGFYVGDRDALFLPENRRLDRELRAADVRHLFRVYHGGHGAAFWRAHEDAWLMTAVRLLPAAPPPRERDPRRQRAVARRAGCPLA